MSINPRTAKKYDDESYWHFHNVFVKSEGEFSVSNILKSSFQVKKMLIRSTFLFFNRTYKFYSIFTF